jgi:hypothetical protein
MIENLAQLAPDASRRTRTLARCHERLAAERRRIEARTGASQPRAVGVERLLVVGACVAYLVAMARDILAVTLSR